MNTQRLEQQGMFLLTMLLAVILMVRLAASPHPIGGVLVLSLPGMVFFLSKSRKTSKHKRQKKWCVKYLRRYPHW